MKGKRLLLTLKLELIDPDRPAKLSGLYLSDEPPLVQLGFSVAKALLDPFISAALRAIA